MYWEKRPGAILTQRTNGGVCYHREGSTEAKDNAYNNISAAEDKEGKRTGANLSPRIPAGSRAERG